MTTLKIGEGVRWVGHDHQCQKVVYDGIITKILKNKISFDVENVGTITVGIKDGSFTPILKDQITITPTYIETQVKTPAKKERQSRGGNSIAEQMRTAMRKAKAENLGKEYVIEFGKTTFNFTRSKSEAYIKCFWDAV